MIARVSGTVNNVWGPSLELLSKDEELQKETQKMKELGVDLYVWKTCTDIYGLSSKLSPLGSRSNTSGKTSPICYRMAGRP
jgi:hypothetical protein